MRNISTVQRPIPVILISSLEISSFDNLLKLLKLICPERDASANSVMARVLTFVSPALRSFSCESLLRLSGVNSPFPSSRTRAVIVSAAFVEMSCERIDSTSVSKCPCFGRFLPIVHIGEFLMIGLKAGSALIIFYVIASICASLIRATQEL